MRLRPLPHRAMGRRAERLLLQRGTPGHTEGTGYHPLPADVVRNGQQRVQLLAPWFFTSRTRDGSEWIIPGRWITVDHLIRTKAESSWSAGETTVPLPTLAWQVPCPPPSHPIRRVRRTPPTGIPPSCAAARRGGCGRQDPGTQCPLIRACNNSRLSVRPHSARAPQRPRWPPMERVRA